MIPGNGFRARPVRQFLRHLEVHMVLEPVAVIAADDLIDVLLRGAGPTGNDRGHDLKGDVIRSPAVQPTTVVVLPTAEIVVLEIAHAPRAKFRRLRMIVVQHQAGCQDVGSPAWRTAVCPDVERIPRL